VAERIGISISRRGHVGTVSQRSLATLTDHDVPEEIITVISTGIKRGDYEVGDGAVRCATGGSAG
jgi:hypothetical protein